ncbi:MAG: hypothetical protein ABWK15_05190 [Dissulfuribacterales bacterium]
MPIRTLLILFTCFCGLCFHAVAGIFDPLVWAGEPRVSAVLSSEIRPYMQAMEGLRSAFPFYIPTFSMANPELAAKMLHENDYDRVVAVGSNAARLALQNVSDKKKVVVLMILDIRENFGEGLCGVDMRVPIEEELRGISEQLGVNLRIAVLFSTEENAMRVMNAEQAAKKLGVRLTAWRVAERADALNRLNSEAGTVDCLLFLPDPIFDSETFISHLVKTALLKGVAPVGYNRFFVETGAALSFNLDYAGIGRQGSAFLNDLSMCGILTPAFQVEVNGKSLELVQRQWKERRP